MEYSSKSICVLGMHRSGTSAITRAINITGASIGQFEDLIPAQSDNPEGFWENSKIVDINERILRYFSRTWDSTIPLPNNWCEEISNNTTLKEEMRRLVSENFSCFKLWTWKDPRTCILLPLWLDVLESLNIEVVFVISIRNPLDVAASLKKRNGMAKDKSFRLWHYYVLSSLYWTRGYKRTIINYDEFLNNWQLEIKETYNDIGIPFQPESGWEMEISDFIKPNLRHSFSSISSLANENFTPTIRLYEYCLEAKDHSTLLNTQQYNEKIEYMYNDYAGYCYLMNLTKNSDTSFHEVLQVFWTENDLEFSEDQSKKMNLENDGNYYNYRFNLNFENGALSIRIDPTNFPAIIYIKRTSLEFLDENDNSISINLFENEEIIFSNQLISLQEKCPKIFFSVSDDPFIVFNNINIPAGKATLNVEMKVIKNINESIPTLIWNYIKNMRDFEGLLVEANNINKKNIEKINEWEEKYNTLLMDNKNLTHKNQILNNEMIEAINQLSTLNNNYSEKVNELCQLKLVLENQQVEIKSLIDTINVQSIKNDSLNITIESLNIKLEDLLSSYSWKITKPLRRLRRFIDKNGEK